MKKVLSIVLAALMLLSLAVPAFAEDGTYNVRFQAPSGSLIANHDGKDLGPAYRFIESQDGYPVFEEDENGIYYLATDGRYYTRDQLVESTIAPDAKTYSPVFFETNTDVPISAGSNLSFVVETNEAYNPASVRVYINGVLATKNDVGEYVVYADRDFTVRVDENALERSHFNVVLTSGTGYSIKTVQGENYHVAYYGDSFRFRIKLASGYSDADMKVTLVRGKNPLSEFLGDDVDLLAKVDGSSETLVSDGVDSDGCRTYTIPNITSDCKISVSGVRENKKADILTYFKRIIKMILDVFHIDTSFLGLSDVINLSYYTVNIDDSGLAGTDFDYVLVTGTEDAFKMNQFNVMGGASVTIELVTYNPDLCNRLKVTWEPGNPNGTYGNVWTASLNRANNKVYYSTTFMIDNIKENTNVRLTIQ